jgi:hypothetical protein
MARNRCSAARGRFNTRSVERVTLASFEVEEFNERERQAEYERYHELSAEQFVAAILVAVRLCATIPLRGYKFWWMISGHPVQLSRHTQLGRTMTAVVMRHIEH